LKESTMAEAKLAPNLPDWMVEHAKRYLASGGTEGHMFKRFVPGRGEITAPALLLTTTGRKSGDKFIFPLFYGTDGGSYFVIASKGGAPQHPGWYRNILAHPDVEVQVGAKKLKAVARTAGSHGGTERVREVAMSSITDAANAFFVACEAGKGWEACKGYCTSDATFSAQAEPSA
jgi:proline iminopeptidase